MARDVVLTGCRIIQAIEQTGMSIGFFEISARSDNVLVTVSLLRLLELNDLFGESGRIKKEVWQAIYQKILAGYDKTWGAYYYKPSENHPSKWLQVKEATWEDVEAGILLDITEEVVQRQQLTKAMDLDPLTGILNGRAFKHKLSQVIASNPEQAGVCIYANVNNLKFINDKFGHEFGDRYIISAAKMFQSFEQMGGYTARVTADEFVIGLHGYKDRETAWNMIRPFILEHCNSTIVRPDGQSQRIRVTMGMAWYPDDAATVEDLVRYADFAMCEAKSTMKGAILQFNRELYNRKVFILDKREAINQLIDDRLVRFAFQPIVDIRSGDVYAYEALMRSQMDEFKTPEEIFAVAAAQSKLYQMEKLTLLTVGEWLSTHGHMLQGKKLFINTLPSQSLTKEDMEELFRRYPNAFVNTVFELTEAENAEQEIIIKVNRIRRNFNAWIAIDDYGSGYSNDLRVLSLNPEIVKIDMGLIRDIDKDENKQMIVSNIVSYCKPNDIMVLAEGLETEAELVKIMELGIELVQGFYFAKPEFEIKDISQVQRERIFTVRRNLYKDL